MEKLERYRGHFYNWYDTHTLKPLHPKYVSSVDSGNLAGALLTLQAGLAELKNQPVLSANAFQGLQDTLQVLAEHMPAQITPDLSHKVKTLQDILHTLALNGQPRTLVAAEQLLEEVHLVGAMLLAWLSADSDGELYYWAQAFDRQVCTLRDDIAFLVADVHQFNHIPTLTELARERSTDSHATAGARYK
ncbi:MAG: Cyclic beta 1-2 glucan synthetase, partial [Candidatus Gallionella acididurans]